MDVKSDSRNGDIISYLTFKLGDELFAANVRKVLNILELTKITKVPNTPLYMKGIINLRGTVLPVIDTRIKFGMPETQFTESTCILVLIVEFEGETICLGALVDSVQEVLEIENNKILDSPTIGSSYKSDFIQGVVEHNNNFIMLLDVEKVFTSNDLVEMKQIEKVELQELNTANILE